MQPIRIGGACLNQTPIDWDNNIANIRSAIKEAQKQKVQILCLPELTITAYGCQDLFLHDWVSQTALEKLLEIVPFTQNIAVAIGLPIQFNSKIYNTTCFIKNGEILGFYAKQFLANDGIHYEKRWFEAWQAGIINQLQIKDKSYPIGDLTFNIDNIKLGFEICEDAWQADRPAHRLKEKKAQLILNPSASHFAFQKRKTRENLVVSSSLEFDCAYVYANQLGNESGRVIYDGDILLAQKGVLIDRNKRFSYQNHNLLFADFDFESTPKTRNYEQSSNNKEFAKAASLALFDYLRKSRAKGYALSLSGGADSSTIAVLIAIMVRNGMKELGNELFLRKIHLPENLCQGLDFESACKTVVNNILFTVYQGTENSSVSTLGSAKNLALSIGAEFKDWNIDEIIQNSHQIIESAIDRKLTWQDDDIALQNIQARSRSPLIWMMANIKQMILLTTSNRSEGDVGYTTMDGDTSGAIAPIAGVDKHFVIQWLKYAQEELGFDGLADVNSLAPTAELRPSSYSQSDEDDLMPYWLMLEIEKLAIYQRQSPQTVFITLREKLTIEEDLLKSYVKKFYRLWSRNQWKRERLAPSFHLDDFNVDPKTWCRFPILSGSFTEELRLLDET